MTRSRDGWEEGLMGRMQKFFGIYCYTLGNSQSGLKGKRNHLDTETNCIMKDREKKT